MGTSRDKKLQKDPRFKGKTRDPRLKAYKETEIPPEDNEAMADPRFEGFFEKKKGKLVEPAFRDKYGRKKKKAQSDLGQQKGRFAQLDKETGDSSSSSSSSSSSESESESEESPEKQHRLDPNFREIEIPVVLGEATRRIAVCGLKWDKVSAGDVYMMFSLYLEKLMQSNPEYETEKLVGVLIYVSQFGREQMKKEDENGPELDAFEDDEGHQLALKHYEQKRARYYFGVVEFSSTEVASLIFDEIDGYGTNLGMVDLSFIPEDTQLIAADLVASSFEPTPDGQGFFEATDVIESETTRAKMGWDGKSQAELQREMIMRKYSDADEDFEDDEERFGAFLSSGSECIEEDQLETYRANFDLDDGDSDEEGGILPVPEETETAKATLPSDDDWESMKSDEEETDPAELTAFEKRLAKMKLKKKEKRKEQEAKLNQYHEDQRETMRAIKKKKRQKEELEDKDFNLRQDDQEMEMDLTDSRFLEVLSKAKFAIDPSHKNYRKSKAMETVRVEQTKKRKIKRE